MSSILLNYIYSWLIPIGKKPAQAKKLLQTKQQELLYYFVVLTT